MNKFACAVAALLAGASACTASEASTYLLKANTSAGFFVSSPEAIEGPIGFQVVSGDEPAVVTWDYGFNFWDNGCGRGDSGPGCQAGYVNYAIGFGEFDATSAFQSDWAYASLWDGVTGWNGNLDLQNESDSDVLFFLPDNVRVSGAVPEPISWTLMLGGFAAIGSVMRTRSRSERGFA